MFFKAFTQPAECVESIRSRKSTKFNNSGCDIVNEDNKVITFATRVGNLYYLEFWRNNQQLIVVEDESKEKLWHRRYGQLGNKSLQKLVEKDLIQQFDYNVKNNISFCETCWRKTSSQSFLDQ